MQIWSGIMALNMSANRLQREFSLMLLSANRASVNVFEQQPYLP